MGEKLLDKPIRILHMIGSLNIGGSQSLIMNLYRNIDKQKYQFDFIIDHVTHTYYRKEIEELGGKIYVFPPFRGYNLFNIIKFWEIFFAEHIEYKILHIHIRSYAAVFLPIAKKYHVKTIMHSHSTSNGKGINSFIKLFMQFPIRYQADFFLACSKLAGEWLFGRRICKKNNFFVLKSGIDIKRFIFDANIRNQQRKTLGIEKEYVIGFLARVSMPKNPLFVIDVFDELLKINYNVKLLFVGDGELLNNVIDLAKKKKIDDHICFVGQQSEVEKMFFAMDFYLLPSFWEGLGISLIEAQATGLKCICSDVIPTEAIVTDLVQVKSIDDKAHEWARSIEEGLKKDIDRTMQYKKIIDAGYDVQSVLNEVDLIYKTLLLKK